MLRRLRQLFRRTSAPARTLSSLHAYALWAANYPPHAHNALMQAEEAAIRALLPDMRGKRVVDLACGSGRYARIAGENGAAWCTGIDNSLPMLRAGQSADDGKIGFVQGDLLRIPLRAACVDIVLCGLAIGHTAELDRSLEEIARVMVAGGIAIISDFHPFLFLDGKQRTFTAPDGTGYAVEHYPHLYSDMHTAATRNKLKIITVSEPRLSIDGRTIPAVIVYKLRRDA